MSIWSWKQSLAESILDLVNARSDPEFTIHDVYTFTGRFLELFPRNQHVREKLRQTLQRLRGDGFVVFLGKGKYRVNMEFEDLIGDPLPLGHEGFVLPKTKTVVRSIRLRSTLLATEVKRRYGSICQLCRVPVILSARQNYAEAHHLQPLGSPHLGPDILGNIIVLCPNHHAMFDRGVVTIVPQTLTIRHATSGVFSPGSRLYRHSWHNLDVNCLKYQYAQMFVGT